MVTGTYVSYYFHCLRHLWLFSRGIRFEHTSEDVRIGKFISENTYDKHMHEIRISDDGNDIVLDFYDRKRNIIHEVKKSKRMDELHIWQVKYYIYFLESIGLKGVTGEIDYPKQKKLIKVELTDEDRITLIKAIEEINRIFLLTNPPKQINKPFCKKCSYYEFCYV